MVQKLLFVAACLALSAAQPTILSKPSNTREVLYLNPQPVKINCDILTELGENVKYEWRKDGDILPSDKGAVDSRDGSLRFPATDLVTEGSYECLAKSELGVASSGIIRVKRGYIKKPKRVVRQANNPGRDGPFEIWLPS